MHVTRKPHVNGTAGHVGSGSVRGSGVHTERTCEQHFAHTAHRPHRTRAAQSGYDFTHTPSRQNTLTATDFQTPAKAPHHRRNAMRACATRPPRTTDPARCCAIVRYTFTSRIIILRFYVFFFQIFTKHDFITHYSYTSCGLRQQILLYLYIALCVFYINKFIFNNKKKKCFARYKSYFNNITLYDF